MKMTRDEKKAFKAYRRQVIQSIEGLRGYPVDGSERRALEKKPFQAAPVQREVVEVLCDFIQSRQSKPIEEGHNLKQAGEELPVVRALWYLCTLFKPRKVDAKMDPYEAVPSKAIFGFDVRAFRNLRVVFETLHLYVAEAPPFFPDRDLDSYVGIGKCDAEAVSRLMRSMSEPCYLSVQRLVMLWRHLSQGNAAVVTQISEQFAPVLLRSPEVALTEASLQLRIDTVQRLIESFEEIYDKPYPSSRVRLGQGILYTPRHFTDAEIEIFLEGNTPIEYHPDDVVLEENQSNWALYRVARGSFCVYVGQTHVATLVAGDWFGETSLLSTHVTRARIVAHERGELNRVSAAHLETIFEARPDLAATFLSVLAYELANRLNVALIQFSHEASHGASAPSSVPRVDPHSGRHVIRQTIEPRMRDESAETQFRYQSDLHAVKAFFCQRIPKKEKKAPRDSILYLFATRVATLYQKGHHQKKTEIPLGWLQDVVYDDNLEVKLIYLHDGKERKTVHLRLKSKAGAETATQMLAKLRASFQGQVPPMPSLSMTDAVAMFDFTPEDASSQLALTRGSHYAVLDRTGGWLYGFCVEDPERKGLFPLSFVELRPYGVLTTGVMKPDDWQDINDSFEVLSLRKGDVVLEEGDPLQTGHLYFFKAGSFDVTKKTASGEAAHINSLNPGESVGELLFLLGGQPRASVLVSSDEAEVLKLSRFKLKELLEKDTVFASRFWKYLCCMLSSRLFALQLRLTSNSPRVPPAVKLVLPDDAEVQAERPDAPTRAPPPLVPPSFKREESDLPADIPATMDQPELDQLNNTLNDVLSDDDSSEGDDIEI